MWARQTTNRAPGQQTRQVPAGAPSGALARTTTAHAASSREHGLRNAPNQSTRIDAVIASATASVAEVCDAQVGQVKTALSHACESEVRALRAVLAEACAGETDKLRNALTVACDRELQRVSSSLATACAQEVESVSSTCQNEVERVKLALRQACELEVTAVREACRSEVGLVKEALREACEAEVRLVRDACHSEVQRVKTDMAEACQQEVAALISSMEHDFALARARQRKELEAAAEPYIRAVHSAQLHTSQQLEAIVATQAAETRRLRTLESQSLRASQRIQHMSSDVSARERAVRLDARLRGGGPFVVLRVNRPGGHLFSLLGAKPKLEVSVHMVRLSAGGEALTLHPLPADGRAEGEKILLSSLASVNLGAPWWCARAAALDLPKLLAAAHGPANGVVHAGEADDDALRPPPPRWHLLTLQAADAPPTYLCAPTADEAICWATGLAQLLSPPVAAHAAAPPAAPYAAMLWRRARLRLDALAATPAHNFGEVEGGEGEVTRWVGGGTRLGALAAVLRSMAAEEESRIAWVRYHLANGDQHGAKQMGWHPPPSPAAQSPKPPPAGGAMDGKGAIRRLATTEFQMAN